MLHSISAASTPNPAPKSTTTLAPNPRSTTISPSLTLHAVVIVSAAYLPLL
jgi:hypothetical protein